MGGRGASGGTGTAASPGSVTSQIEQAYDRIKPPSGPVSISALRQEVGSRVSRADFNAAIDDIAIRSGAHARAEADQKTLTQRDWDDAVVLGGTARHTLLLENSYRRGRNR